MTPKDHNKTISIAHGLIGMFVLTALIIGVMLEISKPPRPSFNSHSSTQLMNRSLSEAIKDAGGMLFLLPIPLLQLLTAYGLFIRRSWARILALVFSVLYVWVFPLGTALAAYTWWYLHSAVGRQLYAKG